MPVTADDVDALLAEPAPTAPATTAADVDALLDEGAPATQAPAPTYKYAAGSTAVHLVAPGQQYPDQPTYELSEEEATRASKIRSIFKAGWVSNPDEEAAVLNLAKQTGMSRDTVRPQLKPLEQTWFEANFDEVKWMRAHPELARWMLENPEVGPVVVRDKKVNALMRAWRWWDDATAQPWDFDADEFEKLRAEGLSPGAAFTELKEQRAAVRDAPQKEVLVDDEKAKALREQGWVDVGGGFVIPSAFAIAGARAGEAWDRFKLSRAGYELMLANQRGDTEAASDLEGRIHDLRVTSVRRDYNEGEVGQVLSTMTEAAASTAYGLKEGVSLGATAGAAAGLGTLVATRNPKAALDAGLKVGSLFGKAGAVKGTFELEAGGDYLDLLGSKRDDGSEVDEPTARAAATISGAIKSMIEFASWGPMLKSFGPLGEAVRLGEAKAIAQALARSQSFQQTLRTVGKNWLEAAATEGGEEFLQDAVEQAVKYIAQSSDPTVRGFREKYNPTQGAEALTTGAIGGVGLAGAGSVATLTFDTYAMARARARGEDVKAVLALADGPAVAAAPDAVAKLIEQTSGQGGPAITALHVDAGAFVRYFQDAKADVNEAAKALMGEDGPRRVQEAVATGGRIEVPIGEYLKSWGGTKVAEALAKDTATDAGALTVAQLDAMEKRADELAKENTPAETGGEQLWLDAVEGQLAAVQGEGKAAARKQVALLRAFVRTQAEVFGRSADKLFGDLALSVMSGDETALGGTRLFQEQQSPEASQVLSERARTLSPADRARELYRDPVTGLGNRRAWDETKHPAGSQVAVITSPDVKAINDDVQGGHDTANALLRHIGQAVGQFDPTAARSGTNFLIHVNGQEGLAAALEQIRSALPDSRLSVDGALGENLDKAFEKLDTETEAKRKAGALPARGKTNVDLTNLPELEKRFAQQPLELGLPEDLVSKAGNLELGAFFKEAYLDKSMPGVLSKTGFDAVGDRAFVGSLDLKGLKLVNTTFGKAIGDKLLENFARVAMESGGSALHFAHLSGDEFAIKGDDRAALDEFIQDLSDALRGPGTALFAPLAGRSYIVRSEFRSGIGEKSYGAADQALNRGKRAEPGGGGGSLAGAIPQTGGRVGAETRLGSDAASRASALEQRRARAQARGVQPQAFVDRPADRAGGVGQAPAGSTGSAGQLLEDTSFETSELDAQLEADQKVAAESRARAEAFVGRMKNPAKKALAEKELLYALGESEERPVGATPEEQKALDVVRKELANRYGIARDFSFDEGGRSLEKKMGGRGRKAGGDLAARMAQKAGVGLTGNAADFHASRKKGGKMVFAGEPSAPRGWTELLNKAQKRVIRIALTKSQDMSTFLHETGHVFLELMGDLADLEGAPARVRDDYSTALQWLGAENRSGITREMHEKWARGFERYLMEGKAPSTKLAGAFERFKLWLREVYRNISALNVELSDDIRGVFDRLLATDRELERARAKMGIDRPLARDILGMTLEQFQEYLDLREKAATHAARQAELTALKDRLRENEQWWKDEYKKELEAAEAEWEGLPARLAQLVLQGKGELWGGTTTAVVLQRDEVVAAVGPENAKKFRTSQEGASPDEVAGELFQTFKTGAQMLDAIVHLPDKAKWSKAFAYERMAEKHGDILAERLRLADEVSKGLHGDMTLQVLERELGALYARVPGELGITRAPPVATLQLAARKMVERRAVGRLDPGATLTAERQAAQAAMRAAAKGNYAEALLQKERQLLNMFAWRFLTEAREERDAFVELASKLASDKGLARLGKGRPVYRDGVASLLAKLGFADEPEDAPSLGEVVQAMATDGATVMFDEPALTKLLAKPMDWRALTVAQMRQVVDALKNIRGAANAKAQVIVDGKRFDKATIVGEIVMNAPNLPPLPPMPSSREAMTGGEKAKSWVASADGSLLRIETMIDWLAGGDMKSIWYRALMKPMQEAKAREADVLKATIKPIIEAFEKVPAKVRKRFMEKVDGRALFPDHEVALDQALEPPTRRFELLMMALNAGNESNLVRLLEGRNITMPQLQAAIDLLTKEELDWVQSIWNASESLWPQAAELEERDTGLRPEKLELRALHTKHGTYVGGYFPAVYDRRVEAAGERQAANQLADLMDPSFTRPGTARSHLKSRVDGFTGAISLSPGTIARSLGQVAHDIAYREAVKSVGNLILDPEVQAELGRRLGDERRQQFLQWVKDIGSMRGAEGSAHASALTSLVKALRGNTITAVLGYSVPTAAGDLANLVAILPRTGLKVSHWAAGLLEFFTSPKQAIAMAEGLSGELRTRRDQLQRDFKNQVRDLTASGPLSRGPLAWLKDHAFAFMEFTDLITSTPIWMGAYRQALAEGKSQKDAVEFADALVRRNFPGHSPVDQAAVLRDRGFIGSSLMFYGYFNVLYNGMRDMGHQLSMSDSTLERVKLGGRMLAFMSAAVVLSELLSGRGREDDEEWSQWYLRKLLVGSAASVPFGGDIATAIEQKALGKHANPRQSGLVAAATAVGTSGWDLAEQVAAALKGEGDLAEAEKKLDAFMRNLGPIHGLPVSQPARTAGYLKDLLEGDVQAENPGDVLGGLLYGQRERQPANLFAPAR